MFCCFVSGASFFKDTVSIDMVLRIIKNKQENTPALLFFDLFLIFFFFCMDISPCLFIFFPQTFFKYLAILAYPCKN